MPIQTIDLTRGEAVDIFIYDKDDPSGIKDCEIRGSLVRAILIPRTHLKTRAALVKQLLDGKVAIYFLLGESEEEDKPIAYIGETGDPAGRIRQHSNEEKKDFFNTAIFFAAEKGKLNKGHLHFIEHKCIVEGKDAGTFVVKNDAVKRKPGSLSRSDESFASKTYEAINLLTSILGCSLFEKANESGRLFLKLTKHDITATAIYSRRGMTVLEGSEAVTKDQETSSLHKYARYAVNKRNELLDNGVLVKKGNKLIFTRDHSFKTPSGAARVVAGKNVNGRQVWKNLKKKSWGELYGVRE